MKLSVLCWAAALCVFSYIHGVQADGDPQVFDGKQWLRQVEDPNWPKPHPPEGDAHKRADSTIFVGISSFRDDRCGRTLHWLFGKAQYPERIYAGVVQQNAEDDLDCVKSYCDLRREKDNDHECAFKDQIRMHRMHARDARGPCLGRALVNSELLKNETFCLQIDAHSDFEHFWDTRLLDEWAAAENEYAVLTTYVQKLEDLGVNVNQRWEVPHLCGLIFVGDGMPRNEQAKAAMWLQKPILNPLWAAGLSFSKCHADRNHPNDPHLKMVFNGEEFSRGARLWTGGYDFYTPRRAIVVHDYKPGSPKRLTWGRVDDPTMYQKAKERLFTLLEYPGSKQGPQDREGVEIGSLYGLGTKRSLSQYIEFSGVDTRNRKFNGPHCANLRWVKYGLNDDVRKEQPHVPMLPPPKAEPGEHGQKAPNAAPPMPRQVECSPVLRCQTCVGMNMCGSCTGNDVLVKGACIPPATPAGALTDRLRGQTNPRVASVDRVEPAPAAQKPRVTVVDTSEDADEEYVDIVVQPTMLLVMLLMFGGLMWATTLLARGSKDTKDN